MTVGKGSLGSVQAMLDQMKVTNQAKPKVLEGIAILVHDCEQYTGEYEGYAAAIGSGQIHHRAGMSFVSNTNGAIQVMFCPWCGIEVDELGRKLMTEHLASVQLSHDGDSQTPVPPSDPLPQ